MESILQILYKTYTIGIVPQHNVANYNGVLS